MDRLLVILIPVTAIALLAFAIVLRGTAARADGNEHRRPASRDSSKRAARTLMTTPLLFSWTHSLMPASNERPLSTARVFLVDEQGEEEKLIELMVTPTRTRIVAERQSDSGPTLVPPRHNRGRVRHWSPTAK
jgi:hypothetical protein